MYELMEVESASCRRASTVDGPQVGRYFRLGCLTQLKLSDRLLLRGVNMFGRQMMTWLLVSAAFLSATAFGQTSSTKRPNPPSMLCIGSNCVTTPSGGRIKWNPGHYMASESILRGSKDLTNKLSYEMSALRNHPAVLGYRVTTTWGAIEKSRGVYDFSLLDQVMKTLKTGLDTPKRLVLVILPGTFSGADPGTNDASYLPQYLRQDDAYGSSPTAG